MSRIKVRDQHMPRKVHSIRESGSDGAAPPPISRQLHDRFVAACPVTIFSDLYPTT